MTDDTLPTSLPPRGRKLIYRDGTLRLPVRADDKTVWPTRRLIADQFQV